MQAVILAAGYGRRMQPFTNECHKALLPVGGTTILGRIMDGLLATEVSDVTVVTGYRAEDVEEFLTTRHPDVTFRFVKNERYVDTNNVVSFALALEQMPLEDDLILSECDLLFDASILTKLVDHPHENVALVDRYRIGMDGTVVSIENGFVAQVFAPHRQGPSFDYSDKYKTINIYKFDREFCASTLRPLVKWYAEQVNPTSYYELVLGILTNIPDSKIAAEIIEGDRWVEVDDPNDLAQARFQFDPERRGEVLDRSFGGLWTFDVLDFAFMRNCYFPTDAMIAALRHSLPALIGSYGSTQEVLNEKLGYFLQCQPSRLQALNGATQIYPILRQELAGKKILTPTPTFGEYPRVFPDATTYLDAPGVDWKEVERLADQSDVVVIVNPNTPAGTTTATQDVYEMAARHRNVTFIVDESFLAFTDEPSLIARLEEDPLDNVIVIASLSKSLGAPGLRLGYVYSPDEAFVRRIGEEIPIWNLNAPAEFLLELLLKFRVELADSLEQTKADRKSLHEQLAKVPGIERVHDSGGNYLLVTLSGPSDTAAELRQRLLVNHRINLKDVTERLPDRAPRLRLAVREPHENKVLVQALESELPALQK